MIFRYKQTNRHFIIIYISSPFPQCAALQAKAIHPTLSSSTLSRQQPRQPGDHFHWIKSYWGRENLSHIYKIGAPTKKEFWGLPCPKSRGSRQLTDLTISANVSMFTWRKVGSQSLMCTWQVVIHLVVLTQSCLMIYLPYSAYCIILWFRSSILYLPICFFDHVYFMNKE